MSAQQPAAPPAPSPQALAVADFLKSEPAKTFKPRTVILQGQRKEMFKGPLLLSPPILTTRVLTEWLWICSQAGHQRPPV
jgi:hypothetical protein